MYVITNIIVHKSAKSTDNLVSIRGINIKRIILISQSILQNTNITEKYFQFQVQHKIKM